MTKEKPSASGLYTFRRTDAYHAFIAQNTLDALRMDAFMQHFSSAVAHHLLCAACGYVILFLLRRDETPCLFMMLLPRQLAAT